MNQNTPFQNKLVAVEEIYRKEYAHFLQLLTHLTQKKMKFDRLDI